jgi:hypothetical protein
VEIADSLQRAEEVEKTVQSKREQYRPISVRGSILFFVIASLSSIDPMYQNSLAYVKKIFNGTIRQVLKRRAPAQADASEAEDEQLEEQSQVLVEGEEAGGDSPSTQQEAVDDPGSEELSEGRASDEPGASEASQQSEVPPVELGDVQTLLPELIE